MKARTLISLLKQSKTVYGVPTSECKAGSSDYGVVKPLGSNFILIADETRSAFAFDHHSLLKRKDCSYLQKVREDCRSSDSNTALHHVECLQRGALAGAIPPAVIWNVAWN